MSVQYNAGNAILSGPFGQMIVDTKGEPFRFILAIIRKISGTKERVPFELETRDEEALLGVLQERKNTRDKVKKHPNLPCRCDEDEPCTCGRRYKDGQTKPKKQEVEWIPPNEMSGNFNELKIELSGKIAKSLGIPSQMLGNFPPVNVSAFNKSTEEILKFANEAAIVPTNPIAERAVKQFGQMMQMKQQFEESSRFEQVKQMAQQFEEAHRLEQIHYYNERNEEIERRLMYGPSTLHSLRESFSMPILTNPSEVLIQRVVEGKLKTVSENPAKVSKPKKVTLASSMDPHVPTDPNKPVVFYVPLPED